MATRAPFPLLMMLLLGVFRATAWSQAATEYGMAAAAAAAAAGRAASTVNQASTQLGDRLQQATPNPQTAPNVQTTPSTQQAAPSTPAPNPPAPIATKTLETVMKENREKLEAKAQPGRATLQIDSLPDKATIFADGTVVGYTPTELKLAAGQHLIELKHTDFMPWRKEVSLNQGETLSLKPKLQYKYQSVITLSGK